MQAYINVGLVTRRYCMSRHVHRCRYITGSLKLLLCCLFDQMCMSLLFRSAPQMPGHVMCTYTYMHYVCMYACMHACMHARMYVCMHACMHACMYVSVCANCICVYIYIWVSKYPSMQFLHCGMCPGFVQFRLRNTHLSTVNPTHQFTQYSHSQNYC